MMTFLRARATCQTFGRSSNGTADTSECPITVLALRSRREAFGGNGTFHTLVVVRNERKMMRKLDRSISNPASISSEDRQDAPRIVRDLSSPELMVVARWLEIGGSRRGNGNPICIFGDCMDWAPKLTVKSDLVRVATEAVLDSFVTYVMRNEETISITQRKNAVAVRLLRVKLSQSDDLRAVKSERLFAIRMLGLVEVCF